MIMCFHCKMYLFLQLPSIFGEYYSNYCSYMHSSIYCNIVKFGYNWIRNTKVWNISFFLALKHGIIIPIRTLERKLSSYRYFRRKDYLISLYRNYFIATPHYFETCAQYLFNIVFTTQDNCARNFETCSSDVQTCVCTTFNIVTIIL